MFNFKIAETREFQKQKNKTAPKIISKITKIVYPQLKQNPYFGINIRKLKGNLQGYYRYRVGSYRLFYLIKKNKLLVVIAHLDHRQGAY